LCGGCHIPRTDTFGAKNSRRWDAEPLRCHACEARDRKAKVWANDENADTSGMYFSVVESTDD